ncbi:hypothetical protein VTJ04DRAFT_1148 [Mycothermus thermophilus]|uniref:uncharacterized protein n=1 Tax=Humicola insolens TaxID=85995 RepID=UPI003742D2AC
MRRPELLAALTPLSREILEKSDRSTIVSSYSPPSNPRSPDAHDFFGMDGPPSQPRSEVHTNSEITLRSVHGIIRPTWDLATLSFWQPDISRMAEDTNLQMIMRQVLPLMPVPGDRY